MVSVTQGRFWTTGGSFANYTFGTAAYQIDQVAGYLGKARSLPAASQFNANGIGYADIVTLGDNMVRM